MIRINAFLLVENIENKAAAIKAAAELVELSRGDKGCVAYDIFASQTIDKHLMICETWQTQEDLDAHMNSAHFKRIVPELQKYGPMKIEQFAFAD
jgi:quinol monooxygenase YgiN